MPIEKLPEAITTMLGALYVLPEEANRRKYAELKHKLVFGNVDALRAVSNVAVDALFEESEAEYIRKHFDSRGNLFRTFPEQAALNYARRVTRTVRAALFKDKDEQAAVDAAVAKLYGERIAQLVETLQKCEFWSLCFGVVAILPEPVYDDDDGGKLIGFRFGLWLPQDMLIVPHRRYKDRAEAICLRASEYVGGHCLERWLYYDAMRVRVLDAKFNDVTNESSLVSFADDMDVMGEHGAHGFPVVFFRGGAVYSSFFDSIAASDALLVDSLKALAYFADAAFTFHSSNFGVDVIVGDLSTADEKKLERSFFSPNTTVRIGGQGTYQRVSREVNVANISKPVDDLLRDVGPRYGISYDETRLIASQLSGLSRFLAREKLHEFVKARRPAFRSAEADLFALMCGYIVDADGKVDDDLRPLSNEVFAKVYAIPEMAALQIEYEEFQQVTTPYENIAALRAEVETGLKSAADLIKERNPGMSDDEALGVAIRVATVTAELKTTATPAAANPLAGFLTPAPPAPGGKVP